MAIRKIARMGHPVLREISRPIEDPTAAGIARLAEDLVDTCEDIGGNGIAAPQIYEPVRMFAYRVRTEVMPDGARMREIPWTVAINPVITVLGEERARYWERCLSLPGLFGQVERATRIHFEWTDLEGERHALVAQRFLARLLQHENDHLDGIMYPMRMDDMSTLGYVSELGTPAYPDLPREAADYLEPEPADAPST